MLSLFRKVGQRIHIGDDIVVSIVEVGAGQARIGIDAPRDVRVDREEVAVARDATADETVEVILRRIIAHDEVLWVRADESPEALGLHVEVPKAVVERWERIRAAQHQIDEEAAGYFHQATEAAAKAGV